MPEADFNDVKLDMVEVLWYEDKVKLKLMRGAPAAITQAYLTGEERDVIVEVTKL